MRKMSGSSKDACSVAVSARALARSRPNGFSTTIRALRAHPEAPSPRITGSNIVGGTAR